MSRWVPDTVLFGCFALPIFLFPLSTAGAGVAGGLFVLLYLLSGHWRRWREAVARPWFWPLTLLIAWTLVGLAWNEDRAGAWVAVSRLGYFFFAYAGATLPWERRRFFLLPAFFLAGLALNWVVGLLQWLHAWPWHPMIPMLGPVGYANHIFLSMALSMALLWIAYDLRDRVLLPRWANLLLAGAFLLQLAMGAGRTGQLLFVILMPAAVWILFRGRWRYWALGAIVLAVAGMAASPMVQHRVQEGVHNLEAFGKGNADTSWGLRIVMAEGAVRMGLDHPLLGVGTGDYAQEMARLQAEHALPPTPQTPVMSQPQNSYLIELAMLGLPGLLLFLWFLWTVTVPAWSARAAPEGWFMLVYMAIFLTGSLSDTLIWGYANVFTLALLTALPMPVGNRRTVRAAAVMHGVP